MCVLLRFVSFVSGSGSFSSSCFFLLFFFILFCYPGQHLKAASNWSVGGGVGDVVNDVGIKRGARQTP